MAYGTLLLHLDGRTDCDARIDSAVHLACRFESHLVGLSASGRRPFARSPGARLLRGDDLAAALERAHLLAEARAAHFEQRAHASALRSHETIVDDDDDAAALVRHGLCCDVVILGRPDPAEPDHVRVSTQFELALLHGAPPALVLPRAAAYATVGDRILVGWNGTRECSRAVAAAMPLLQQAQNVQVLHAQTPLDVVEDRSSPRAERVHDWLAHNGVRADVHLQSTADDAGTALLACAKHMGADLVVMGAWGRMRWSERLFGGVTRTMLGHAAPALLLAH